MLSFSAEQLKTGSRFNIRPAEILDIRSVVKHGKPLSCANIGVQFPE